MLAMLLGLLVICVVCLILLLVLRTKASYGHIPGPPMHCFPVNNGSLSIANVDKALAKMQEYYKRYGNILHLNVFGVNWVVLSDLESIRFVMRDRESFPNDGNFRKALTHNMGRSMFASEGDIWKEKHSIILPLMSQKMMEHSTIVVQNKAQQLIDAIHRDLESTKAGQESIEFVSLMKRFTIDVIGEMAFGVDFQALSAEQRKYGGYSFSELASSQLDGINARLMIPTLLWSLPLPVFKKEKQAAAIIKGMFDGVVEQTKATLDAGEESTNLPGLILKARESDPHVAANIYPREDILGECFSVWGAGHDTTTYTCAHVIKLLAIHQNVQAKLRKEIMALDESLNGIAPNFSEINHCVYLNAVIKEAQRLYPLAPFFLRECSHDTVIQGKQIPKNTTLIANIYALQTSKEYFESPMEYKPERWVEDSNLPFLTFGMGKRSCFGKKLALLEIKLMVFYVLKNFQIEDDSSQHPHVCELNFGYVPKGKKMQVTLTPLRE
uniref:Cytochrome P450 n=1 Tax=Vannella robusta TaxID=1487602 RepID=A0A7S4I7V9_9EUKA